MVEVVAAAVAVPVDGIAIDSQLFRLATQSLVAVHYELKDGKQKLISGLSVLNKCNSYLLVR